MRNCTKLDIALLLTLLAVRVEVAVAQVSSASGPHPSVTIAGTQLRIIKSKIVGQDYLAKVRLPEKYGEPGARYPVLYLLDGDHAFAMSTDIVEYLSYGALVPDLIIVSPAYGSKHGPSSGGTNMRDRDFSVPAPTAPKDARGDRYLRFLKEELIPYVDREFRTDTTNRTLWGYSAGARFALYAMFQEPGLFQRYVVIDGFASYLPEMEKEYAAKRGDLPIRIFMASAVPQSDLYRFAERLRSRGYQGLWLEYADLAGMNHFAVAGEGLARGLKSVYNKKSLYEELLSRLLREDFTAMLARYHTLKAAGSDEYNWGEGELNELGVALYRMERPKEAVDLLKLNVATYPESWTAHQTLADVYRLTGERAPAIEHYIRSLKINPKNARAAEMLQRLRSQQ